MEQRLLRIIMNPAMIATWVFGLLLVAANHEIAQGGWFHVKFAAVILMSALHGIFAKWRKTLAKGPAPHSAKFYKLWNEAPTILMIIIVFMVIVKPF